MMKNMVNREKPSKMAEGMAMHRFGESSKNEDERICYDPYAIYFISPENNRIWNETSRRSKITY